MRTFLKRSGILGAACIVAMSTSAAFAAATANSGNSSATLEVFTTGTDTLVGANFVPGGGAGDYLFESGWYYRLGNQTQENRFLQGATELGAGNTITQTYAHATEGFGATLLATLVDGADPNATLTQTMTVTNNTIAPMTISLFHFYDIDDLPTFSNDTISVLAPNTLQVNDGADGTLITFAGPTANAWDFTAGSTLDTQLENTTVTNFASPAGPTGPADVDAGFQWNLTIAPGAAVSVTDVLTSAAVPEPATLSVLAVGSLATLRRRRRD